jgi:DNA ligase (NAD+)
MNKTEIVETLESANEVYRETGQNGIPEAEYNRLMDELTRLDPDHPLHTQITFGPVSSTGKVVHKIPMLSLDKAYTVEEVQKWMKKVARSPEEMFELTPKLDGVAGRIDGSLLCTRGNSEIGEDISHFLPILDVVLDSNKIEGHRDGEILITKTTFAKEFATGNITRSSGEKYKTPRNAVSGILNNDHVEEQWKGVLTFIEHSRHTIMVGFHDDLEEKIDFVKDQIQLLGFPTDGLVLKVADPEYAASLGHTSHHWKHSIALKHANDSAVTRLIDVEFQMAKDHIGMVGILEPVEINGVSIRRVSLHNLDVIKELGLKVGDIVTIERAGDVIPHIVSIDKSARSDVAGRYEVYCLECPSCRGPVWIDKQFYVCDNPVCEDKVVNKIDSALKDLDSKGIATATIKKLVNAGTVKNVASMFYLNEYDFQGLEGMGERSISKILDESNRLRNTPQKPEAILAMLNIPGFGKSIFKKLLVHVPDDSPMTLLVLTKLELMELPNMAETRAEMLRAGFAENQNLILDLREIFTIITPETQERSSNMKNICFTGKGNYGRKEYEAMCEGTEYIPASSVTALLDILVCADPSSDSGKMKKARKMGAEVISYGEFEKKIG